MHISFEKQVLVTPPTSPPRKVPGSRSPFRVSWIISTEKTTEKQKHQNSHHHYIFWNGYNKPLSHQINICGLNLTVSEPKLYTMVPLCITSVYIIFLVFQSSFPEWVCLNSSAYCVMVNYFGCLHATGRKCSIFILWISKFGFFCFFFPTSTTLAFENQMASAKS